MNYVDFTVKFKEGDVIKIDGYWIIIYCKLGEPSVYFPGRHAIIYHAITHTGDIAAHVPSQPQAGIGWIEDKKDDLVRLATNDEKQMLFERMKECGCKWDETNLRVVEI